MSADEKSHLMYPRGTCFLSFSPFLSFSVCVNLILALPPSSPLFLVLLRQTLFLVFMFTPKRSHQLRIHIFGRLVANNHGWHSVFICAHWNWQNFFLPLNAYNVIVDFGNYSFTINPVKGTRSVSPSKISLRRPAEFLVMYRN